MRLSPVPLSSAAVPALAHRTLSDWLAALVAGADVEAALHQTRRAAQEALPLSIWIHLCPEPDWAAQLQTLQERLDEGPDRSALLQRYPLLGVPFAVKDNINIAGQPTSAACPTFKHNAQHSASVVQRLLDAGALWLGKTNLDQFATGLVGTRSPYGRPACVFDAQRISGGSSSGSAVAVARGIVPFALGTDTAGSGRVPAGFNGIVGLKPTPGRVSTAGVVPACRTLDCVSVFAHSATEAAHVLALIEGADPADEYSCFAPGPAWLNASRPQRLRVAVPQQPVVDAACGYAAAWQLAREHLAGLGHEVVEIDFSTLHAIGALLYEGPWVAERHAVVRGLLQQQPQALDPVVRQVIARALEISATDGFEAQYQLQSLKAELRSLWSSAGALSGVDVLMVPTAPTHPSFQQVDADPLGVNTQLGLHTNFVNLLGWCALALPAAPTTTGLPFGVTFIARGGFDAALLPLAQQWSAGTETTPLPLPLPLPSRSLSNSPPLRSPATQTSLRIAVVGAHLSGLPLNSQLRERDASLVQATTTSPHYRLFALPGTTPPKPGLQRVAQAGAAIALEVWEMPSHAVGSFLALIPAPLGLGSIELANGQWVHGFLCEHHALQGARDISPWGGWRAYLASL
jgi:allophanate hydrolase